MSLLLWSEMGLVQVWLRGHYGIGSLPKSGYSRFGEKAEDHCCTRMSICSILDVSKF
jgi:hypothetical protein